MRRTPCLILLLFSPLLLGSCNGNDTLSDEDRVFQVGAERLFTDYYHLVEDKRVGLITNHSALVGDDHIADLIHADEGIELTALFGPEHGIRGTADAGEPVDHGLDEQTGIPVFSLYGDVRRPTMVMLEEVDLLIFDIQDVGARFYTYLITMGRAMQSAAEAGIPYLVLDRPNPLGGNMIEGHIREERYRSGIGMYPTPITHGMTAGEFARMIRGEEWHEGVEEVELHIVEMEGWSRDMLWYDTGLEWTPPSPNIPDVETAIVYPGTCFFEGTNGSEGRGTYEPFIQVGSPFVDPEAVAAEMNRRELPGLYFHATEFIPESIIGMSREPKLEGDTVYGVKLEVTDPYIVEPVAAGIHLLQVFYEHLPKQNRDGFFIERGMQIRAGIDDVQIEIQQGLNASDIMDWQEDVASFRFQRAPYLIYE